MHHTYAPFRLLRTTLVGGTVLGLAAGAHVLAGGVLPGPGIMAALMALHVLCTTVATTIHIGLPAMLGLLSAGQLVLHHAFDAFSAAIPATPALQGGHGHLPADGSMAAMLQAAAPMGTGMEAMHSASAFSGWMLPAHMAATLLTALLLAHGENVLWALATWLRPLCRRATAIRPLPARQACPKVLPAPLPHLPWRNLRPDTRRGPPNNGTAFA